MDNSEETGRTFPSPRGGTESSNSERAQPTEGITMMRWEREDGGRMSRRETTIGRRTRTPTPIPHRVSAMPNAAAGARGDSDSDDGAEVGGTARQTQRPIETATGRPDTLLDQQNQQLTTKTIVMTTCGVMPRKS